MNRENKSILTYPEIVRQLHNDDARVGTVVRVDPTPGNWGTYWDNIKVPARGTVIAVDDVFWGEDEVEGLLFTVEVKDTDGNIVKREVLEKDISPYLDREALGN